MLRYLANEIDSAGYSKFCRGKILFGFGSERCRRVGVEDADTDADVYVYAEEQTDSSLLIYLSTRPPSPFIVSH